MNLDLITEYEQTLIGRRYSIFPIYFQYSEEINEKMALEVMKYAFETYLKWSPYEIRDGLTMDILKMLKLDVLLKYIVFPIELDPKTDLYYIAWCIYPNTIHLTDQDLTINVYKNLLNKKIEKFPKEFFTGIHGMIRACVCLKYMVENNLQFYSIEDAYKYFASKEANTLLKKNKLSAISKDLYETNIDYFHDALSDNQKDDFWYHYYKFNVETNSIPIVSALKSRLKSRRNN